MGNSILIAGDPKPYRSGLPQIYEKTSSDVEQVAGRVGCVGSSTSQAKIYTTGSVPLFVFDYQSTPGYTSSGYDKEYATDGKPVDTIMPIITPLVLDVTVKASENVSQFSWLDAENGTGKLINHVDGGYACAFALEASSSSSDRKVKVLFFGSLMFAIPWGPLAQLQVTTETVTVTTNQGTLTNTPKIIEYVERTTGTNTGGVTLITSGTVASGECKVDYTNKTIDFNATDAVTEAIVRYWY